MSISQNTKTMSSHHTKTTLPLRSLHHTSTHSIGSVSGGVSFASDPSLASMDSISLHRPRSTTSSFSSNSSSTGRRRLAWIVITLCLICLSVQMHRLAVLMSTNQSIEQKGNDLDQHNLKMKVRTSTTTETTRIISTTTTSLFMDGQEESNTNQHNNYPAAPSGDDSEDEDEDEDEDEAPTNNDNNKNDTDEEREQQKQLNLKRKRKRKERTMRRKRVENQQKTEEELKYDQLQKDKRELQIKLYRAKQARERKMQQLQKVFPGLSKLPNKNNTASDKTHQGEEEHPHVDRLYPSPASATTTLATVTTTPNVVQGCGNSTRNVDEIQLHIIGWKRVEGIQSLLQSLKDADYTGWTQEIPLYIHTDGGSAEALDAAVQAFEWKQGPKYLDQRAENVGLRNMWLTSMGKAAEKAGDNTLMLVFEDDIHISPVYFQWLLAMIDRYARNPQCRDSDLVGFSLSPIVFQELYQPFYPWDADKEVQDIYVPKETRHSAFLTSVPSSWGAAFWSDHWQRFDAFVTARMQPPFYNVTAERPTNGSVVVSTDVTPEYLHIPGAYTNRWTRSWKRFMVDLMYAQGKVMLYPNLPGRKGFANALQDDGEHGAKGSTGKNYFAAELMDPKEWKEWKGWENQLPSYVDLMVFGLDHKLRTKELLVALGTDFLNEVSANCTADGCSKLLKLWAREGWAVPSRGYEEYPLTCIVDAYTSAAAAQHGRPDDSTHTRNDFSKYLVFDHSPTSKSSSREQEQQRRAAVLQAHLWAKVLGRTLVLPPASGESTSDQDRSQLSADWQELLARNKVVADTSGNPTESLFQDFPFLRLPGLDDETRDSTISFEEFEEFEKLKKNDKPWRMIRATTTAAAPQSGKEEGNRSRVAISRSRLLLSEQEDIVDLRHLLDQPLQVETIQHLLGGCDDHVLAFESMYFGDLKSLGNANKKGIVTTSKNK